MKYYKIIALILVIAVAVILVLERSGAGLFTTNKSTVGQNNSKKIQVAASFYPLYFFASEIGGDHAEVKNITPAGSEPHDYDPTTSDIARIEKSNMLVLNGGTIEAWGDKIKENLKGTNVEIVTAGNSLLTQPLIEKDRTFPDPHIWLSPKLAKKEVNNITEGYVKTDPDNASYYLANEKSLDDKLDLLDQEYKQGLSNCKQKDIITSHAAFGYLAGAYGLNQVPISGLSPDSEPSSQQLVEVVKFAKAHSVKYIFFESLVSPKLSETIAREVGVKTLVLDPLEGLTDDEIKQGRNYFSVMDENLKNLELSLQCGK